MRVFSRVATMIAQIPARGRPTELTQLQTGLFRLQSELTSGLASNDDQYEEVVRRAEAEPCLRLVYSDEKHDSLSREDPSLMDQFLRGASTPTLESPNVKRFLAGFLPKPCLQAIESGAVQGLEGIVAKRGVAVNDFTGWFHGTASDNKEVKQFRIIRFPDWNDTRLEVYNVRLEAKFESRRALWKHSDKISLDAEYKMRVYSASRSGLISRSQGAEQIVMKWIADAMRCP